MKKVYIYCEGQTEEIFINEVLAPYFWNMDIYVTPIVCETKRNGNRKFKGGVSEYKKIKKELLMICKNHHHEYVTTMFDYYAMPEDTPNIKDTTPDIYDRIENIEKSVDEDIAQPNCFFNLMLHEFEGLLFSNPQSFSLVAGHEVVEKVNEIKEEFPTPEHINNSPKTAPSKRLESIIANYAKVKNGAILTKDMGIDIIMKECKHFERWINKIKSI